MILSLKKYYPPTTQQNADYLPAKITEHQDRLGENKINVAQVGETKLHQDDPTPLVEEYDHIREDQQSRGMIHHTGVGMMTCIQQGIQYSAPNSTNPSQKVIIHMAGRQQFTISNTYMPHHSSNCTLAQNQSWKDHHPTNRGIF